MTVTRDSKIVPGTVAGKNPCKFARTGYDGTAFNRFSKVYFIGDRASLNLVSAE